MHAQIQSPASRLLDGIMLLRQFPLPGVWAIGIVFGPKMIIGGWFLVFISIRAKEETSSYHLFTC